MMDWEVRNMTGKLASSLLPLILMFTITVPAAAGEPVSEGDLAAIRAANPWVVPAEKEVEIWLDFLQDDKPPVVENLGIPRQMGITFAPASFSLFREGRGCDLKWMDDGRTAVELRDETGKLAHHSFGNGPVHGGGWYGYFVASATRWVAEFDGAGRIIAERYYFRPQPAEAEAGGDQEETVMTSIEWRYDDAFSASYPSGAKIDHSSSGMFFEVSFQFLDGRWMVAESKFYHDGELTSRASIRHKAFF